VLALSAPTGPTDHPKRVWIRVGWSRSFELKRLGWHLFVATPLSAWCAAQGHALLMVAVFFVSFWPFPYRARLRPEGLEVSWLFVREVLRLADIEVARLRTDVRTLRLFRHPLVLEIQLVNRRPAIVLGSAPVVEALHAELTDALAARQGRAP